MQPAPSSETPLARRVARLERDLHKVRRELRKPARRDCDECRTRLSRRRRSLVMQLAAARSKLR